MFPWQIRGNTHYGEVVTTDRYLLIWIIIGGALEFVGAQASVISFNGALAAGYNGGIVGAIIALNSVYVLSAAYCMFGESITLMKLIAIASLITSVVLVSMFPPDEIMELYLEFAGTGTSDTLIKTIQEIESKHFYNQMLMIIGGLVASFCFGSQLLVFKHVTKYTKDITGVGFGFLFTCGLIGVASLAFEFMKSPHVVKELPLSEIIGPFLIGAFSSLAIVLANIAAGIGIAGISNSIIHCSLVIVTVFNYFIFRQPISSMQVIGVFLTVLGGILLAFDNQCKSCIQRKRESEDQKSIQNNLHVL